MGFDLNLPNCDAEVFPLPVLAFEMHAFLYEILTFWLLVGAPQERLDVVRERRKTIDGILVWAGAIHERGPGA